MTATKQPILWHEPQTDQIGMWAGLPFNSAYWPGSYTINQVQYGQPSWGFAEIPNDSTSGESLNGLWGSAWCSSDEKLYSLGGHITHNNANLPVNGMVTHTYSTNSWTNTTRGVPDRRFNEFAQMHFVSSFGSSGVLVMFGGERPPLDQSYSGSPSILADMSVIDIYDIEKEAWYTQQATGEIPGPTTRFSSVGVSSSSNDSYEIFMLSGSVNTTFDAIELDDQSYRDIHVLSIPAFRWFRANSPATIRRTGHSSQVVGSRQMLVIGGSIFVDAGSYTSDPEPNGLGIFDLSSLQWTTTYNATAAAYERPTMVENYYRDNHTTPSWSDEALRTLFPFRATLPSPSTTSNGTTNPTMPSSTTLPTPEAAQSKKGTPTGAIVGAVLGALALIVLGVGLFIWRRRRARRSVAQVTSTELKDRPFVQAPEYDSHELIAHNMVHEKDSSPTSIRHELGDQEDVSAKDQPAVKRYELS